MINAKQFFELAQLAEASYARLESVIDQDQLIAQLKKVSDNMSFSATQAAELAAHWSVSAHQPNTASGFSSTLFKSLDAGGGYVLAIRGTEPQALINSTDLLVADIADIVADGVVIDQSVDLYNEWKRITSTGAYTAAKLITLDAETAQLADIKARLSNEVSAAQALTELLALRARIDIIIDEPSGRVRTIQFESSATLFSDARQTGLGLAADIAAKGITVTGHSLGGHLADVFDRLFAGAGADAFKINGAGFATGSIAGLSGNAATNIRNLFGMLGGATSFDSTNNLNLYGDKNPEIVAMNGPGLFQQGGHEAIFIEQDSFIQDAFGHGASQIADSLAVYDLLIELDTSLQSTTPQAVLAKLNPLFEAASNDTAFSLEAIVGAMGRLFTGTGLIAQDNRESLYGLISDIKQTMLYQQSAGLLTIQPLTEFDGVTIAAKAQAATVEGLAYRYALANLVPFAITGDASIYASHNANGELDLYDPATGTGSFTSQYVKDRAAMLSWKMKYDVGAEDADDDLLGIFDRDNKPYLEKWDSYSIPGDWDFIDDAAIVGGSPLKIEIDGVDLTTAANHQVVFGSQNADVLTGGKLKDWLYGGAGADTLTGKGGNDYLEGGAGYDTYIINAGDGFDTILDTDGLGVIKFGAIAAQGSASVADGKDWIRVGNSWTDRQNGLAYLLINQADGTQALRISSGSGSVTVKDWSAGELGIELGANTPVPPPVTDLTLVGDLQPIDFDPAAAGVQTETDELGNVIVSGEAAPGRADALYGGAGNDHILSLGGDDYADGRGGQDHIEGGAGQDLLQGGAGNDILIGGTDSDVLAGGADDDRLHAETETTIDEAYTLGETQAASGQRGDLLDGGFGDDTLIGHAGNDILMGGTGKDVLMGLGGDDTIEGDADFVYAERDWSVSRVVTLEGGSTLYSRNYSFATVGTDAGAAGDDDAIYGGAGNDWIFAQGGNDFVDGGADDDVIFGGAGNDIILGQGGHDVLVGDSQHPDLDASLHGDDYLSGGDGHDKLWGGGGADYLEGGEGNDLLMGDGMNVPEEYEGDDVLDGGAGEDQLFGGGGNDTLIGGADADQLYGGTGVDTYIDVDAGDVIGDLEGRSIVRLAASNGVSATTPPSVALTSDATLKIALDNGTTLDLQAALYGMEASIEFSNGDAIDLESWVSENLAQSVTLDLNNVQLSSGAAVTRAYGGAGVDQIQGGAGNEVIKGYGGDDLIFGRDGNDQLYGGAGNDHLQGDVGDDVLDGGDGADSLLGGDGSDTLLGGAGNDELQGGMGDDVLDGGSGNDTLFGQEGSDVLDGGTGNDVLLGNAGDDVYVFTLGGGQDVIWEEGDSIGDVLRFGEGIAPADISVAKSGSNLVLYHANGTDQVTIANWYAAAAYRLERFEFADGTAWNGIDAGDLGLLHLRGTPDDDAIYGGALNETLVGLDGNDLLYGNGGNDVLLGGRGNDALTGDAGTDTYLFALGDGADVINGDNVDTLRFAADISTSDVTAERVGYDLLLRHQNGTDSVKIANWYSNSYYQLQKVMFDADGTSWSAYTVGQMGVNFGNAYTLNLGDGTLTIQDWGGVDSLVFGAGIDEADILISRIGQDLKLAHVNGTDSVRIKDWFNEISKQIETIQFSTSGAVLTTVQLTAPFLSLVGTAGNDIIQGGNAYGETLTGMGGNDTLNGNGGADTYYFNLGDGQDTITDTSYGNTLIFGTGLLELLSLSVGYGEDTVFSFGPGGDSVRVTAGSNVTPKFNAVGTASADTFNGSVYGDIIHTLEGNDVINGNAGDDELHGGAGNDTIIGGAGRDWLYGGDGDDVLDGFALTGSSDDQVYGSDSTDYYMGGKGNDTLYGNSRNDTYYFDLGDGNDMIIEGTFFYNGQWYYSSGDELIFGAGITPENITISKIGTDLKVQIGATDSVTVKSWFDNSRFQVDTFQFSDGRRLTATDISRLAFTLHGTVGDDILTGDSTFDNVLYGEAGNDTLTGGSGADALHGGEGDDALNGGSGNDEYFFERGGGRDTIYDWSGTDTVRFDPSITATDVSLSRNANDLVLSVAGTDDALTIRGYFNGDLVYMLNANSNVVQHINRTFVETFSFSDGSQLPAASAIRDSFLDIRGTSLNDELTGTDWADVLYGGDGNDVLHGVGSGDVLYGEAGDDYMAGGANSLLYGGDGNDVLVASGGYMQGGLGNDTYYVAGGSVLDMGGSDDKLVFYEGTTLADLDFQKWATYNLWITSANGEDVDIYNHFLNSAYKVERLVLADGTVLGLLDIQFGTGNALTGSSADSILIGSGGNDTLSGGGGNDWLNGQSGNDTMIGGMGNDYFFVDSSKDVVTELENQGTDTVSSSITYTLGSDVENLVLSGAGRINGTGNSLNNVLAGNSASNTLNGGAGNDWLDGRGGADTMAGGTGDDTYVVDVASDKVTERTNEGIDTVLASISYTLGSNIENLTLTGAESISGTGNALNNVLIGNSAANMLSGAAGNDTLDGVDGVDTLTGGKGNDTYIMGRGYSADTVIENDTTTGTMDIAQFLSGVSTDQIWFQHVGNNLEASIIGAGDKLVIQDWYLGNAFHVEQFKTTDGAKTLLDSNVQNLVNAMASFVPPAAGETTLPQSYQDALAGVIAANWQ